MRDYQRTLDRCLSLYRGQCADFKTGVCARKGGCHCTTSAEIAALTRAILPGGYGSLHLKDFTGHVAGEATPLPSSIVLAARERLAEYCWGPDGKVAKKADFASHEWFTKSWLDRRRRAGTCLVIHGDGLVGFSKPGEGDKLATPGVRKRSTGKTLLASIVMQEAIRRRAFSGHEGETYEWVSFPLLKSRVLASDGDAVGSYQNCDWLVVDDIQPIERVSENMKGYQLEKLNAVFVERQASRLPTILVFQFDVTASSKDGSLADKVGVALAEMVAAENTFNIRLTPDHPAQRRGGAK